MGMSTITAKYYLSVCLLLLAAACTVAWRHRGNIALFRLSYWRWLLTPWKLMTFFGAAAFLTTIAPYTQDRDWNYSVAILMSTLTFATAPWTVGVLWRRRPIGVVYVAVCVGLLSASWSFDWYWWVRRGFYPDCWLRSLCASSTLYLAAGLLWNLDWRPARGVTFAFRAADWPSDKRSAPFARVAAPAILLIAATGSILCWTYLLN
jgi:hypothetical protein